MKYRFCPLVIFLFIGTGMTPEARASSKLLSSVASFCVGVITGKLPSKSEKLVDELQAKYFDSYLVRKEIHGVSIEEPLPDFIPPVMNFRSDRRDLSGSGHLPFG